MIDFSNKKIWTAGFLLLWCSICLFAQSRSHQRISVFVPPVTGTGIGPEDNEFFLTQLNAELLGWDYNVTGSRSQADYVMNGKIAPNDDPELFALLNNYSFRLELYDNKAGASMVEFGMMYDSLYGLEILITALLYTLLNVIPEPPEVPEVVRFTEDDAGQNAWRNKWLYLGGSAFWTPRVYVGNERAIHVASPGAGISGELQFLNFLSFETGVELASDIVAVSSFPKDHYQNLMLEIPVLLKLVFKPKRSLSHFLIEPYGGIYWNIQLLNKTRPPLFSWLAGLQYGVKVGQGVVFVDPRFAMDIGKSSIMEDSPVNAPLYQRYIIHIGVGYKHGFLQKK